MICLKIRTFVVSATTNFYINAKIKRLWFAWKFVPLWYQQQLSIVYCLILSGCDLLENSYLCGISNNMMVLLMMMLIVVICLKIRTFVVSATTTPRFMRLPTRCDLLENSYLCGISNNILSRYQRIKGVVICLKIRTFVVSATTRNKVRFVSIRCDLLENSYLCGISNNALQPRRE